MGTRRLHYHKLAIEPSEFGPRDGYFEWVSDVYKENPDLGVWGLEDTKYEHKMPEFLHSWLIEHVGDMDHDWGYVTSEYYGYRKIFFKSAAKAMLFKMKFDV